MELKQATKLIEPVIILSAPRAGSTLLFETLARHPEIWTIGGESHQLIEHVPSLSTVARGLVSNALGAEDADAATIDLLRTRFLQAARTREGRINDGFQGGIRLLEKTPKNALRIPFLLSVFPDAKFIYLVRDPRENISSIMEGWKSGRFTTYPHIDAAGTKWSFLLPDGWRDLTSASLADIARFQWQAANDAIIACLKQLPEQQFQIVSYQELVEKTPEVLAQIAQFANLTEFSEEETTKLPLSRYTLTPPCKDKWKENQTEVEKQLRHIQSTQADINHMLVQRGLTKLDVAELNNEETPLPPKTSDSSTSEARVQRVSRNTICPCGSGKKYKHCHGIIVK
ncbi:sulfotransferase family protein [Aliiglaciecola lipolytica]|uniref:SEC-C motif domain protein n=1 Tax=Aliiglaciecola lipolytica E3 TaxID=1127673 RepID=K6YBQ0_9ALTE|nr:sulfotransferase [Aliiglaciecola lipolytica]GAC14073.1 hypothetical protein GLIP_1438 [Aliiglaciecola lipolytica E3]